MMEDSIGEYPSLKPFLWVIVILIVGFLIANSGESFDSGVIFVFLVLACFVFLGIWGYLTYE